MKNNIKLNFITVKHKCIYFPNVSKVQKKIWPMIFEIKFLYSPIAHFEGIVFHK